MKEITTGYILGIVAFLIIAAFVAGRYLTFKDATADFYKLCENGRAFTIEGSTDIYSCYNVTKYEEGE